MKVVPMPREIQRLLTRWREQQERAGQDAMTYSSGGDSAGNAHAFRKEARIWRTCADQLEAALLAASPAPAQDVPQG